MTLVNHQNNKIEENTNISYKYEYFVLFKGDDMPQVKSQTLSLGEYWNAYIEASVGKDRRYASASELVRDSLRLLEERDANSALERIRKALIEGEKSGDAGELDMNAIRAEAKLTAGLG
jgi:antitoxin ParD1/3/4